MAAVAIQHKAAILERVAAGHYLAQIAASLGLAGKGQAISNALASDPEYQAARELGLEYKLANREAQLEAAAKDDVPRARELLSHARWRAEREAPHRWGQRTHVSVEHVGDLADRLRAGRERLRALRERVIDADQVLFQTPAEPELSHSDNRLASPDAPVTAAQQDSAEGPNQP